MNSIFVKVKAAAQPRLVDIIRHWLPGGQVLGQEYVVRNPRRADRRPGSFSINTHTGAWADFATGDKGRDIISLAAYLAGCSQYEAALKMAGMLGVHHG